MYEKKTKHETFMNDSFFFVCFIKSVEKNIKKISERFSFEE